MPAMGNRVSASLPAAGRGFICTREISKVIHMIGDRIYPLDQLRGFGADPCDYEGCAIYFLWRFSALIYIGQTRYLPDRIYHHIAYSRMGITAVTWCEVDPEDADAVERDYILAYRPRFNQLAGRNIADKARVWI